MKSYCDGFFIAKRMHMWPVTRYTIFLLTFSGMIYDGHTVANSKLAQFVEDYRVTFQA